MHVYIHEMNWIKNVHIYIYTIQYAHAYNYTLYVLSEKGDRQQLLRAELKLKLSFSTTHS